MAAARQDAVLRVPPDARRDLVEGVVVVGDGETDRRRPEGGFCGDGGQEGDAGKVYGAGECSTAGVVRERPPVFSPVVNASTAFTKTPPVRGSRRSALLVNQR